MKEDQAILCEKHMILLNFIWTWVGAAPSNP